MVVDGAHRRGIDLQDALGADAKDVLADLLPVGDVVGRAGSEHLDVDGHLGVVLVRAQHHHRHLVACVRLRRQSLFEQRVLVVPVAQPTVQQKLAVVHRQNHRVR